MDLSVPLKINNSGYYRIDSGPIVVTDHPEGRNDYQLLYIAAGQGYFYFDDTETIVTKGNMVLYRPGDQQVYYYNASDKTEVYWVHFTGAEVETYLAHYGLPEDEQVFFTGTSPDYQRIYNQIIQEMQLRRANYEELLTLLLCHIFLLINRYHTEGMYAGTDVMNEIERAAHYFNDHYTKDICIEEYARSRAMSKSWFIHCFKKIMKITPMQYIVSLRLSAAKNFLERTDKNVTEISYAVGYDNPLYFSRLFKKHVGLSPLAYKKRYMDMFGF
ncbi:MAG: helix-turn-helix transcriptional regulator [Clostridia bacterium]|nr:helix-turn-helix transcriptional regulator [Clostridia bacterium]